MLSSVAFIDVLFGFRSEFVIPQSEPVAKPAAKKQRTAEAEHAGSKGSKQPAVTFQVERILNHRKSDSGMQYLVKWESYGEAHNSWEPEDHILDPALLTEYNKRR